MQPKGVSALILDIKLVVVLLERVQHLDTILGSAGLSVEFSLSIGAMADRPDVTAILEAVGLLRFLESPEPLIFFCPGPRVFSSAHHL
jgi:hypothetical protein